MIRSQCFTPEAGFQSGLSLENIAQVVKAGIGLLWVDFEGNPPEQDEPILREIFGFHPLAIDDALQETHVPKLDDWGDYLYIVLQTVSIASENVEKEHPSGMVNTHELDVFLGKHFIVTHHDDTIAAVDKVWKNFQQDPRHQKNGADGLLYRLVDEVVANYMPAVEKLEAEIDEAEDTVFDNPDPRILEHIFTLKRSIVKLRRVIDPQREVLNRLARDEFAVVDRQTRVYFRDVYDHLVRMHDIVEGIRDLVSGALDIYLSVVNNRMNDIVKTLTVITTLFMPISFMVGFFGMNFFAPVTPLVEWTGRSAFFVVMGITVVVPLGMYFWIRRRGWM
jgi:magnesium transporter